MQRTFILITLLCLLSISIACNIKGGVSLAQSFFYPENTGKTYTDWTYYGQIDIWGDVLEEKSRRIDIVVEDRKKKSILKDTLNITGKEVNAYVTWKEFEQIKIVFYDGPAMRHDDFEKKKATVKILREIAYGFNKDSGKFQRNF